MARTEVVSFGSLPGIAAFSSGVVQAIEALDLALSQENVPAAVDACDWLADEVARIRLHLGALARLPGGDTR